MMGGKNISATTPNNGMIAPRIAAYTLYSLDVILCFLFVLWDMVLTSLFLEIAFWSVFIVANGFLLSYLLSKKNKTDGVLLALLPLIYSITFFFEELPFGLWVLLAVLPFLVFVKKSDMMAKVISCFVGAIAITIGTVLMLSNLSISEHNKSVYYQNSSGKYAVVVSYYDLGATGSSRSVRMRYTIIEDVLYFDKTLSKVEFRDVNIDTNVEWLTDSVCAIGSHIVEF